MRNVLVMFAVVVSGCVCQAPAPGMEPPACEASEPYVTPPEQSELVSGLGLPAWNDSAPRAYFLACVDYATDAPADEADIVARYFACNDAARDCGILRPWSER